MKENLSTAPVLALPNLHQPFKIEIDASEFSMGAILMQGGEPVCYHSKTFLGAVNNYPTYDKELYALVRSDKNGNTT